MSVIHAEHRFAEHRALRSYIAEREMLSMMLGSLTVRESLSENLSEKDFTDDRCRIVFTAMHDLTMLNLDVDLILLTDELRRRDQFDGIGAPFVGSLR